MDDKKFMELLQELKPASDACWAAKLALHNTSSQYAPLCIQILVEGRKIPKLINNSIENRQIATGLDPIHPDFWNDEMVIALYEHFKNTIDKGGLNACTS